MKIIIGLGNPGEQYTNTRHNIGFEILDEIQKSFSFSEWEFNKKFNAVISKGMLEIRNLKFEILLLKPQTFMNLSGNSVRTILDFYRLSPEDILVIQDDLDIEIGTYKIATDSRAAGHNGVQNIIDQLGTQKFTRLRIGIGKATIPEDKPSCRLGAHDFVLGRFTQAENEKIEKIYPTIVSEIKNML